ncbi:DUF1801 domain-containing protein [Fontisubflavum oceani]|uniref:DUF1801 domain-containing protein n=1 Tax=Fontisubflavum oceani TaxID=2978973 RepID=UPI0025B39125|nr:DUF1801 domain-containing protein [Fontisubflavum oceani]WJY21566.1 DUF1801 domain-containing protein [Fontisubflavum oceani]
MIDPPPTVAAVFAAIPTAPRERIMEMRDLIFAAAEATDTGPLTEMLKWGQPAYLTEATKAGTTIRLGWSEKQPEHCALYVHCQTDLLDRYRARFPSEFTYDGARAVLIPTEGAYPQAALQQVAAMALTYHRDKSKAARP